MYNPDIRVLLDAGFDVVTPNVRGSTGSGAEYLSGDERGKRWNAVRDGVAVGLCLRSGGVTDIFAMGRSYGGLLALCVAIQAAHTPDERLWKAVVSINGITHWPAFLAETAPCGDGMTTHPGSAP